MEVSSEHVEHPEHKSPLPETANHCAPRALPLVALTMGLLFVGILLLTLH